VVNTEGELARLAARTMRADELRQTSKRIVIGADGSHWSQAAARHGKALYARGRIADALAMFEQAWQSADKLDDPIAGALAAGLGGGCCATLYDYPQAEQWYSRELDRARSRLVASLRRSLTDLLASAHISQGNIAGARDVLAEFEGASSNHFLLAYHEGDWERAVLLLRRELDASRANGQVHAIADCASILGRFARIGNQRAEAEEYLNEALVASLAGPDLNRELFTRIELALVDADLGRVTHAKKQLQRCQQILDNGEDWRGHNGSFAYASAVVSADDHIRKLKSSDELLRLSAENGASLRLPEEVVDGFRAAIEIFRRYNAPWEEAAALIFWSRVLSDSSRHRQAAEKFNAAFAIFERLETPQWSERLYAELFRFLKLDSRLVSLRMDDNCGSNIFRKEGDYWTISFQGCVFRMRDTMGMHYISRLIANPGMDLSALDLAANAHRKSLRHRTRKKTPFSANDAHANGDRDDLHEAAREGARLRVTKRVKDAIAKIRLIHPELARHLATSIRTGYSCSYGGDDKCPIRWLT
jgi:tetratricopeptide (TPR) repeat protein